jgi:hypothetical protein
MLRSALTLVLLVMAAGCAIAPAEPRYAEAAPSSLTHCLMTGSRILTRDGDCTVPGHYHSAADVRRTGALTAAGVLRSLDPSITIREY